MDFSALMGSNLKLRHLVLALAINQQGSLVRAAEKLYLTQPALSRSLRELESAVGAELFVRTPTGMIPTSAGQAVLDHAREIIGHVETMERRVAELSDPGVGSVVIGAHVTGANSLVPRAVGRLLQDWPGIDVTIRESPPDSLIQELLQGDFDLLVGRMTSHISTQGLDLVPLYHEPFRVAVASDHPLRTEENLDLERLQACKWVAPVTGTPLRDSWEQAFTAAGVSLPAISVECGSPMPTKILVRDFGFLAVLPESLLADERSLEMLPQRFLTMTDSVGLMLAPSRNPTAAAELTIEAFKAEAHDLGLKLGRGR